MGVIMSLALRRRQVYRGGLPEPSKDRGSHPGLRRFGQDSLAPRPPLRPVLRAMQNADDFNDILANAVNG